MVRIFENDDELAVVLCHEISHAILNHVAEKLNLIYVLSYLTFPIFWIIGACTPGIILAIVMSILYYKALDISVNLPYSRKLENEADEVIKCLASDLQILVQIKVGLGLAARACVDVRQAVTFWKRMERLEPRDIEFLSTHPLPERRWRTFETLLDDAMLTRELCNCPPLKDFMNFDQQLMDK